MSALERKLEQHLVSYRTTRCRILRLNALYSISDPAGGAYSAPLNPLAVLGGLLLREEMKGGDEGRRVEEICWKNIKLLPTRM